MLFFYITYKATFDDNQYFLFALTTGVQLIKRIFGHSPIPRTESIYEFILMLNFAICHKQSEFTMNLNYY